MKYDLKSRKQAAQIQEETVPDNIPDELKSTYENVWGQSSQKVIDVELGRIFPYKKGEGGQPYKMNERKISQIAASAEDIGIITPLQVRDVGGGNYEIISGHHRYAAAKQIGLLKVPCIVVKGLSDDEIFKMMSESNIQRDRILPSEYGKMFTVYLNRKKDIEMTSSEIASKFDVSSKTMYRYVNIAKMTDGIQALFDEERINVCAIDHIADFSEDVQNALYTALTNVKVKLSVAVSKRLKKAAEVYEEEGDEDTYTLTDEFEDILTDRDKQKKAPKFSNKVYENIHRKHHIDMTEKELDELTSKLLDEYFNNHEKSVEIHAEK
ncbi:MAG: ParB/RepB/Spo0J family partition protein [Ruminococcus sp.]|nr:ParB/RepB/Spo0J family partition protein [Ruminococcus sp.]